MKPPLEHEEQVTLAKWLTLKWYTFYKSPSETYTTSWNQKRKNKEEGVTKWFPDTVVVLQRGSLLFVELKRKRPTLKNGKPWAPLNKPTPEQLHWIETLESIENVGAVVAYGSQEAIDVIEHLESL